MTTAAHPPAADISIIAIEESSLSHAGAWPVAREDLARLIDQLTQGGASLIVLALPLTNSQLEPANEQLRRWAQKLGADPALVGNASVESLSRAAQSAMSGDERLARSVRASGRVVLASPLGRPTDRSARQRGSRSGGTFVSN